MNLCHATRQLPCRMLVGAALFALTALVPGISRAQTPIVIGAIYNLTGGQQDLDIPSSRGAKLAIDQVNQTGGVLGGKVELILVDGQTKPGVIARETLKLLQRQTPPVALLGLSDTDMVLAAARIAAVHSHVFITSGATSPRLPHEIPRFLFLACFGDNVQAAAGAEFAFETLKARSAVVLYKQNSSYAGLLHGYFETRFKELGGKVLTVRGYSLADIKAKAQGLPKADLIYLAAQPDDVAAAIAALRGAGANEPILGGDGLDIGNAWQQVAQAEKIYFTTHAYLGADNPDPRVQAFRAVYAKAYPGQEPGAFAALGYDAARLLLAAIASAGSSRPQPVLQALARTNAFAGVTGTISFHNGRIPVKTVSIIAVTHGRQALAATVLPKKIPAP